MYSFWGHILKFSTNQWEKTYTTKLKKTADLKMHHVKKKPNLNMMLHVYHPSAGQAEEEVRSRQASAT